MPPAARKRAGAVATRQRSGGDLRVGLLRVDLWGE
jgi:hypothetical protein